ncbi:MAG: hypothetical protein HY343_05425, partial [Lentisphaerae bacterium]|nr:hypothetical protein [Lentisphaerota bacterium]
MKTKYLIGVVLLVLGSRVWAVSAADIAGGAFHSLAVSTNGTVWAWG